MSGRSLARSGLLVTSALVASRVLGYVRLAVIGQQFGAGADLDAFYAAFRIPDLIYQLVAAGAMASAVVPVMSTLLATDVRERAWRVASTVINLMLATLIVLAIVAFIAAPALMPAITPGFDAELRARTVELTRIMLVSPILLAAGAMATSLLNTQGRFSASVLAPITYNLAIIGGAVLLSPSLGVAGLAIGVVAGAACHIGIQLRPLLRTGFRWSPRADPADPRAREILRLMGPRVIGLAATQFSFVVVTSLASGVGVGAVAAFAFAFALFMLPSGIIGTGMGIVSLPSMSRSLATGEVAAFTALVERSLKLVMWTMAPVAGLLIVLRTETVAILLGYGRFDADDVALTASALVFLPLAILSESMIAIQARAFYAARDTMVPVIGAVLAVVVNTTVAWALVGTMGLAGIGLGIAIGSWLETILLLAILRRRVPAFDLAAVSRSGLAAIVAAGLAALVAIVVVEAAGRLLGPGPDRLATILVVLVAGGLGLVTHLAAARLAGASELMTTLGILGGPVRRVGERLRGRP